MTGKKKVAAVLLICTVIAALAGYYMWNKPHLDVAAANAPKIEAGILYNSFITDSSSALKKYGQQVVEVSGTITGISKNQQQQTVLLLSTGVEGASINCTMEGSSDKVTVSEAVSVKGICEGLGQGDADLGILGDLYLVRCYLTDK